EKVDFDGEYYTTSKAKLYSPPLGDVPVLMAAGGPKSAAFAGANAGGLITSVKVPAETVERVITPFREAMAARGRTDAPILATRWVVLAEHDDEAWEALDTMRGLRAPGRLEAVDPMELRLAADAMDRDEILSKYTIVRDAEQLIDAYRPLVTEVGADYVAVQVASTDPAATIELVGTEVLPALRELGG
ncbi:MAG: LLM class flavin-dependent oxidoreductase, partial [Acidimicrobiia bacterium]|nr:LLM class flavin-dependent oxidoreductase [Acidimicrobiia bacterium]